MLIIATGMDNTGKTTLVESLSKKLEISYDKSPGPGLTPVEQIKWTMMKLFEGIEKNTLMDRFFPMEEIVYGKIIRKEEPLIDVDELAHYLNKIPHLIIYTRPPREYIFNWGVRGQMEGVIKYAPDLIDAYDKLMNDLRKRGVTVIKYDYVSQAVTLDDLMAKIKSEILTYNKED